MKQGYNYKTIELKRLDDYKVTELSLSFEEQRDIEDIRKYPTIPKITIIAIIMTFFIFYPCFLWMYFITSSTSCPISIISVRELLIKHDHKNSNRPFGRFYLFAFLCIFGQFCHMLSSVFKFEFCVIWGQSVVATHGINQFVNYLV